MNISTVISIYSLKHLYRRMFGRFPRANKTARGIYHAFIRTRLSRFKDGMFKDVYGLKYNFDENSVLERQMAAAGYWEQDTKELIDAHALPGDVVVEVGSNFGGHTLPLALKVGPSGHVYAIEPSEYAFDRLLQNIALNPGLTNISTAKKYVSTTSDDNLQVELTSYWTRTGEGNNTAMVCVSSASLDVLFADLKKLDLLKIDVDGADQEVLLSGRHLLEKFHPKVYIEVSPSLTRFGTSPHELCELLTQLGYALQVYSWRTGRFASTSAAGIEEVLRHQPVTNVLCVPRVKKG